MNRLALALTIVALAASACKRVPSDVIQPEEMAALSADLKVASAVVDVRRGEFANRASREALKAAVFKRHGVTEAEYDSSLVWYGHNIGKFQEVNERTIELLEQRLADAGSLATAAAMSAAGDSVDIWEKSRTIVLRPESPTEYITFSFDNDRNWEKGDVYTWRIKFTVQPAQAEWAITAEYDDGGSEMLQTGMPVSSPGRHEITFFSDSLRTARHISGWLRLKPQGDRPVLVDSIALVRRRRYIPEGSRRTQRTVNPPHKETDADSIQSR